MAVKRLILIPGRTTKQGQLINRGKDTEQYQELVQTLQMNPEDMAELGVQDGSTVRVRTEFGEAVFRCRSAKDMPRGLMFVPYSPLTSRLMGGHTHGTGMPTSKGWEVEVEPVHET